MWAYWTYSTDQFNTLELTPVLFISHRYPNKSVDEIHRIDNTDNYIKVDIVGITGKTAPGDFVDEKGLFSAVAPENGMKHWQFRFILYFDLKADLPDHIHWITIITAPAVLSWNSVIVSTKPRRGKPVKNIINDIKGCISGGLWGIMGASGSGKTTLLSVLSLRLDTNRMKIEGDVRINGNGYNKNLLKAMSGYVMQDDLVHAELTVYETLM